MNIKTFDGGLYKGEVVTVPVFIGIDQSYGGFAITALSELSNEYYTWVYKAEGTGVVRLNNISIFIEDIFGNFLNIQDIAMEGYAFGSQIANMLGELGGVVKLTIYNLLYDGKGRFPVIVPPTTLKKYATGKGQGVSKSQILLSVYKKWGVEFTDDNAADSYVLAHLISGRCQTGYEQELYEKVQDPKYREGQME